MDANMLMSDWSHETNIGRVEEEISHQSEVDQVGR